MNQAGIAEVCAARVSRGSDTSRYICEYLAPKHCRNEALADLLEAEILLQRRPFSFAREEFIGIRAEQERIRCFLERNGR